MMEEKNYCQEMFEQRLARLRGGPRHTAPWEVDVEVARRVNSLGCRARLGGPIRSIRHGSGFLPFVLFDQDVAFDSLSRALVLSGGVGKVLVDDSVCKITLSLHILESIRDVSCGSCPACRIGLARLRGVLEQLFAREGLDAECALAEQLAYHASVASACEVGRGSRPVLEMIKHFRPEFEDHPRHCRACARRSGLESSKGNGVSV